jgi:heme exporter protein CcmD
MKDYSFYIGAAYAITALVLGGLVILSLWQARAAEKSGDA